MSLELLREKFGYSGVTKEVDNREKIHEKLSTRFTYKKDADNEEKIHEKLNAQFNDMGDFKNIKVQHQEQLDEKQRIIENLETETSELTNEVVTLKKEKAVLLDDLNKSKWMEDQVHSTAKQIYEDKIKTMSYVDSTELIPLLISVSRKKQGNTKLNWGNWLKISENKYLFQINENIAKRVFEDTNVLIDKYISFINRRRRYGGDVAKNYFLSFTGNDEHNQLGRNDTARVDLVATQFTPNDPTNKGFDEGSGRKPLAESGFTVAYWWRPDELYSDSFSMGWKRDNNGRFEFGIKNPSKPYFSIGGSEVKNTTWQDHFDNSGQGHLSGSLLDGGAGTSPGSGNNLILNKWYHIVATYAGTDNVDGDGNYLRKIYINGYHIYGGFGEGKQSVNWNTHTSSQMNKGLAFGIRAVVASGTNTETGLKNVKYNNGNACGLDEIAIYSEEKDATWVSSVYDGGTDYNHKNSGGNGLVGYWRFEEASGDTVKDLSGYGWHGTLTNAAHGDAMDGSADNSSQIKGINARFPNAKPTWEER